VERDQFDKETNKVALERILFHLEEAIQFCHRLDLSSLGTLEQEEWDVRMKTCKSAIQFTMKSVQGLSEILSKRGRN
jgi:hypothetical protein